MSAFRTRYPDAFKERDQLWSVAPLAGCDHKRERTTSALTGQVDLAGQSAPGASQGFVGAVLPRPAPPAGDPRRVCAGTCCMLMGAAGGGVHADHAPVDPACRIGVGLDGPQDLLPCAVRRPASMPVVQPLPLPEPCRQIPPRYAGPLSEENAMRPDGGTACRPWRPPLPTAAISRPRSSAPTASSPGPPPRACPADTAALAAALRTWLGEPHTGVTNGQQGEPGQPAGRKSTGQRRGEV